jgi:hypothetical protein
LKGCRANKEGTITIINDDRPYAIVPTNCVRPRRHLHLTEVFFARGKCMGTSFKIWIFVNRNALASTCVGWNTANEICQQRHEKTGTPPIEVSRCNETLPFRWPNLYSQGCLLWVSGGYSTPTLQVFQWVKLVALARNLICAPALSLSFISPGYHDVFFLDEKDQRHVVCGTRLMVMKL